MALVTGQSFKEYYNGLVIKQQNPSVEELVYSLYRAEVAERRKLEKAEWDHFEDVLHRAGIMVADKKRKEKNQVPLGMTPGQLEAYHKSRVIWFPEMVPRDIPKPIRSLGPPGYPHIKARELFQEEGEIRTWIVGVEDRLREDIIRKREDSLMAIKELNVINSKEDRGRTRLLVEEAEVFAAIRKSLFLAAPPDYFRQKVIERYGVSEVPRIEDRELTLEEVEEKERQELEEEERHHLQKATGFMAFIYATYFHILNHTEIVGRQTIEQQYKDELFTAVAQAGRRSSGLLYYYTPAIAFFGGKHTPVLKDMAQQRLVEYWNMEKPVVYTGGTVTLDE